MKKQWEIEYPLGALIVKGFTTLAEILGSSLIVFIAWNFVMPKLGIIQLDSYFYAVALFVLSRFLLNDHILSEEPTVIHCDCMDDIETPLVVENKK